MNEKKAREILLAYACCTIGGSCDDCPWNNTYDCANTAFTTIVEEAINVLKEKN